MSEIKSIMSIAGYAKARNVDESTIRHQIALGVIIPIGGKVDVEQADAAWFRIRRSRITVHQDDQGRRSAEAKIVGTFAKLRLAKDRLDQLREQYLNRKEVAAQIAWESKALLAVLEEMPERYAGTLAELSSIEEPEARKLLTRFVALVLAEIGDLEGEAIRAAEAA